MVIPWRVNQEKKKPFIPVFPRSHDLPRRHLPPITHSYLANINTCVSTATGLSAVGCSHALGAVWSNHTYTRWHMNTQAESILSLVRHCKAMSTLQLQIVNGNQYLKVTKSSSSLNKNATTSTLWSAILSSSTKLEIAERVGDNRKLAKNKIHIPSMCTLHHCFRKAM